MLHIGIHSDFICSCKICSGERHRDLHYLNLHSIICPVNSYKIEMKEDEILDNSFCSNLPQNHLSFIKSKINTEFYTDSKIKRILGLGLRLEDEEGGKFLLPSLQHSRVLHISRKTYLIHLVMCWHLINTSFLSRYFKQGAAGIVNPRPVNVIEMTKHLYSSSWKISLMENFSILIWVSSFSALCTCAHLQCVLPTVGETSFIHDGNDAFITSCMWFNSNDI